MKNAIPCEDISFMSFHHESMTHIIYVAKSASLYSFKSIKHSAEFLYTHYSTYSLKAMSYLTKFCPI